MPGEIITTAWVEPASVATVHPTGEPPHVNYNGAWTDATDGRTIDGSYATADGKTFGPTLGPTYFQWYNFDFGTLRNRSIIRGFELKFKGQLTGDTGSGRYTADFRLENDASPQTIDGYECWSVTQFSIDTKDRSEDLSVTIVSVLGLTVTLDAGEAAAIAEGWDIDDGVNSRQVSLVVDATDTLTLVGSNPFSPGPVTAVAGNRFKSGVEYTIGNDTDNWGGMSTDGDDTEYEREWLGTDINLAGFGLYCPGPVRVAGTTYTTEIDGISMRLTYEVIPFSNIVMPGNAR